jgi:hypothetical protein
MNNAEMLYQALRPSWDDKVRTCPDCGREFKGMWVDHIKEAHKGNQ